jgi:5-formyltetrahydrofolate cyclo-ligase
MATRAELRRTMRRRRRELEPSAQREAADRLALRLHGHRLFRAARRIALYFPNDGEIDPTPALDRAWGMGKRCYLPVLFTMMGNRLRFARVEPDTRLDINRLGIPEPRVGPRHWLDALELDLVVLPLVAFDAAGNRLGMGGGFYDRTLADRRHRRHWRRPCLLGIAHDFQRVDHIEPRPWDVPLDGIVTDARTYPPMRR